MTDDVRAMVQEHHADIQVIKADLATLRASTISNGQKLDRLFEIIQKRAGTTVEDLAKWLQVFTLGAALIGGVVTAIVYVAGNINAASLAVMEYRLKQTEERASWLDVGAGLRKQQHGNN